MVYLFQSLSLHSFILNGILRGFTIHSGYDILGLRGNKDFILALTSKTFAVSLADIGQRRHELLQQAGDDIAQLDLIQKVLEMMLEMIPDDTVAVHEMLCEV